MKALLSLVRAHWRLQRREPFYWIITLGLAITIIVVAGSLFADPASPRLGLVLEDGSPLLRDSVDDLSRLEEIELTEGSREEELRALENGDRWAVLVIPDGSARGAAQSGGAEVELFYSDRGIFEATSGRGVWREFVARLNSQLSGGDKGELLLSEQTIEGRKTLRFLDVLFPGILGMTLMFSTSWAAGMLVWWRQLGVLKRIGCSPLRPVTLEAAQLIAFAFLSALQVVTLVGLARLLFGVEVAGSYVDLALIAGLGVLTFTAIWYAFAAFAPTTTNFFSFMNLVSFVMIFLGGSAFPLEDVPGWLQPVVKAVPLTYLNEALRGVINHGDGLGSMQLELGVLGAWTLLGFGASVRVFRWGRE